MAYIARWKDRRRVPISAPVAQPLLRSLAAGFVRTARHALAEPYQLVVERHAVRLRRLPRALDGLRVVQLSDIHHSPFTDRTQIERAVELANGLDADVIALTGDYVSHERGYAAPCAEMLGRLRARCGVYAVLGNHDHWTDAALVTDLFRAEGIRVLVNEGLRFEERGATFWLAGVDDTMVGMEDLPLALAGSKQDEMKLLLAHNPIILR
ncbi:MAG: metallophosphoesterase, partial [Pyrinomonadaceae bacterium]